MIASQDSLRACNAKEVCKPIRFGPSELASRCREPVVASTFGGFLFRAVHFLNEFLLHKRSYGPVECSGTETHLVVSLFGNLAHDAVAMKVAVDKREKNVEGCGR